ncbi:hypothetical protein OROHE_016438 [Orobanche hederae]
MVDRYWILFVDVDEWNNFQIEDHEEFGLRRRCIQKKVAENQSEEY